MLRAVYYALLYRRRAARRAVLGREFIKGTIPTSHESRYPLFLSLSLSLSLSLQLFLAAAAVAAAMRRQFHSRDQGCRLTNTFQTINAPPQKARNSMLDPALYYIPFHIFHADIGLKPRIVATGIPTSTSGSALDMSEILSESFAEFLSLKSKAGSLARATREDSDMNLSN